MVTKNKELSLYQRWVMGGRKGISALSTENLSPIPLAPSPVGYEIPPVSARTTAMTYPQPKIKTSPEDLDMEIPKAPEPELTKLLMPSSKGLPEPFAGVYPKEVAQMPTLTWLDKVQEIGDDPVKLVPFLSSGVEIYTIGRLLKTAKDYEDGKEISKEDLLALKEYVDRSLKETTWGYKVTDVVTQIAPFAGEFIATGGIFSAGKTVTVKAATIALKKLATKTGAKILERKLAQLGVEAVGTIAGGTLRALATGTVRVPAGTLEKQLASTLIGGEETVFDSAKKAFGEHWVEIVSESTGGAFGLLTKPVKGQLIKIGLFKAFLKANPTKRASDLSRIFNKLGYHGVLGEMFEERVAQVGHGILYPLGLSDQKFSIPSMEQLSIELAAFSVPGVVSATIGSLPGGVIPGMAGMVSPELPGELEGVPPKPEITPVTPEVTIKPINKKVADLIKGRQGIEATIKDDYPIQHLYKGDTVIAYPTGKEEMGVKTYDILAPKGTLSVNLPEVIFTPKVAIPQAEPGMPEAGYQPTMIEGVPEKEVRPAGKGKITQISMEDQLKLQEARRAAEEAPDETREAYEAQAEIEGLKVWLETEPASKLTNLIKKTGWYRGEIKNLTLKQYRDITGKTEIKPNILTADRKHVKWEYALDDIATELGYADSEALKEEIERAGNARFRINQLTASIGSIETKRPLPVVPELTTEEATENQATVGQPKLTLKQATSLAGFFGDYVMSENAVTAWELTRQLRRETLAGRVENLKARAQELIVSQGLDAEVGMKQAIKESLSGELPALTTEYFQDMSDELRSALFSMVYHNKGMQEYPLEMTSTVTALTNALTGRPIPRERGKPTGRGLFPEGGSAWDRLNYVFGKQPKVLKAIEKMAEEKKPLRDVVEGIYKEVVEGGNPPIPLDQATADYLRGLSEIPFGYKTLLEKPFVLPSLPLDTRTASQKAIDLQNFKLELAENIWKDWSPERLDEMSYLRINLLKTEYQTKLAEVGWTPPSAIADQRTPAQRALDLDLFKIEMAISPIPITPFDPPIEKAFKEPTFKEWTFMEKKTLVKVFKEIGWTAVDIGNLMRAMKTTLDNSYLRQSKALAAGHPLVGFKGHKISWQAMFRQSVAEETWERVIRRPWFPMYDQIREETGIDPLRVPAFAAVKGTERYRTAEEFGFPTIERWIPRLTAKSPLIKPFERAFSAGTNEIVAGLLDIKYTETLRRSEKIASGKATLKAGESFDMVQEFSDNMKFVANMIQRATLPERARGLAPVFNAFFFALRSKLGRFFAPIHLTGLSYSKARGVTFNPRIMQEAWRDFIAINAEIAGIMFLGSWLGLWDLEDDPRNAEFMSARIGDTRVDPWAGQRQFAVLYSRLVTKTGINSVTGAEYEVNPPGAVGNFIKNSLSPMASTLLEFWTGRNFLGQVIDFANGKYWVEKITAMSLWDIWEAFEGEGWGRAAQVTIPTIYGEGVQTYTGDWEENFTKLGLPKYIENTAYGIDEPYYDTDDFWADTSSQFKGVDPATLTEKKGFPPYIKAIAEARVTLELLDTLPREKLITINADPAKGLTFKDYFQQWKEREKLVTAGDNAELTLSELQPSGKYKDVTYKGDDAVGAFDKNERNKNAKLGNLTQKQYALLIKYHSRQRLSQAELSEISVIPYEEWLKTHPKENAQLAIWGQPERKMKVFSEGAYEELMKLLKELDIPDNAFPDLEIIEKEWGEGSKSPFNGAIKGESLYQQWKRSQQSK